MHPLYPVPFSQCSDPSRLPHQPCSNGFNNPHSPALTQDLSFLLCAVDDVG